MVMKKNITSLLLAFSLCAVFGPQQAVASFSFLTGNPLTENNLPLVVGAGVITSYFAQKFEARKPWPERAFEQALHGVSYVAPIIGTLIFSASQTSSINARLLGLSLILIPPVLQKAGIGLPPEDDATWQSYFDFFLSAASSLHSWTKGNHLQAINTLTELRKNPETNTGTTAKRITEAALNLSGHSTLATSFSIFSWANQSLLYPLLTGEVYPDAYGFNYGTKKALYRSNSFIFKSLLAKGLLGWSAAQFLLRGVSFRSVISAAIGISYGLSRLPAA